MGNSVGKFWKAKVRRFLRSDVIQSGGDKNKSRSLETSVVGLDELSDVESFYGHLLRTNLKSFEKFARQSQSRIVLDVFARGASCGRQSLMGLVSEIETIRQGGTLNTNLEVLYDPYLLLSLAALVSTTARSDLDTQLSVLIFDFVRAHYGTAMFSPQQVLQYVEALGDALRFEDQVHRISELRVEDINPLQVKLLEVDRIRKESGSEEAWLTSLNSVFSSLGMSAVALSDNDTLPLMDRLTSSNDEEIIGPKITVIMPTYSPGEGIHTAIRSILEQSWKNLEIVVVDDGSPREYDPIFNALAARDPRIHVLRQRKNAGPYVARNAGLAIASGEFITTHDDDDWSHPDKLATQVQVLLDNKNLVATTAGHIRTTSDMFFKRINSRSIHTQKNYSSLMFRREIVEEIGSWDEVNRGADSEFEARLTKAFGKKKKVDLKDFPASFSRVWQGSLTSGEMRRGYQAYSRQLYYYSYLDWHDKQRKPRLEKGGSRPYPVPSTFEAGFRHADLGTFDLVIVSDFYNSAKDLDLVLRNIEAAIRSDLRVGFMHIESPRTAQRTRISSRLFELQLAGRVSQISHDDQARARLLVVYDPSIGMYLDEIRSTVQAYKAVVVCDISPTLEGSTRRSPALLQQSLRNLDCCFSTVFQVAATSKELNEQLESSLPRTRLVRQGFIWRTPLVDFELEPIVPPSGAPVVGYHSFANEYRWPSTKRYFEQVYVSKRYNTVLYGHIQPAVEKFGEDVLTRLNVLEPSHSSVEQFLEEIDFWIYWPDDRLVEYRAGQPILEAMRAGKVVILPEKLRRIYGDAALYATPSEIEATVMTYTSQPSDFIHQAKLGQRFVEESHTLDSYMEMISRLLG